jgi:hypothetical protein
MSIVTSSLSPVALLIAVARTVALQLAFETSCEKRVPDARGTEQRGGDKLEKELRQAGL